MATKKDGGPAFPQAIAVNPEGYVYESTLNGMSLRDWFAGQALAGMMAQSHAGPKDWTDMGHGWGEDTINQLNAHKTFVADSLASFAYALADAMLVERAKS